MRRLSLLCIYLSSSYLSPFAQTLLAKQPYIEIPLSSINPKGWLLNQLQIMRSGSTGHLDEVHSKLKNDNGWLGGKGDGWEETPY